MAPYARIGCVKVAIVNLNHGIVIPQFSVWDADTDLWNKVSAITQRPIVELFNLIDRYV
jgi:hypothetical protein